MHMFFIRKGAQVILKLYACRWENPKMGYSGVGTAFQGHWIKNKEKLWASECPEQFTGQHAEDDEEWMME